MYRKERTKQRKAERWEEERFEWQEVGTRSHTSFFVDSQHTLFLGLLQGVFKQCTNFLLIIESALQYLHFVIICFLKLSNHVMNFPKKCSLSKKILILIALQLTPLTVPVRFAIHCLGPTLKYSSPKERFHKYSIRLDIVMTTMF